MQSVFLLMHTIRMPLPWKRLGGERASASLQDLAACTTVRRPSRNSGPWCSWVGGSEAGKDSNNHNRKMETTHSSDSVSSLETFYEKL